MATYRPIKKWLLPILAVLIGFLTGFSIFISKEDHAYSQWVALLTDFEKNTYTLDSNYKWDEKVYSQSHGIWSKDTSYYELTTPISNGEEFSIKTYLFADKFYVYSGRDWFSGNLPHRFMNELAPLDNPFQWTIDILKYAESVNREVDANTTIYHAVFKELPENDFRGTLLNKQENTYLSMTVKDGEPQSLKWVVNPIRPDSIGPFKSYPEKLLYQLNFSKDKDSVPLLPKEAETAEEIE